MGNCIFSIYLICLIIFFPYRKVFSMKRSIVAIIFASLSLFTTLVFAETVTIDFESLTSPDLVYKSTYTEDGYRFISSKSDPEAFLSWQTGSPYYSGTAFANNFMGETTTLSKLDGELFNFNSIDLAGVYLNDFFIPGSILKFNGLLVGGSTVSQDVKINNPGVFTTFKLEGFSNLVSVSWTQGSTAMQNAHQFDNLVLSAAPVPEPSTWILMAVGLIGMISLRCRKII